MVFSGGRFPGCEFRCPLYLWNKIKANYRQWFSPEVQDFGGFSFFDLPRHTARGSEYALVAKFVTHTPLSNHRVVIIFVWVIYFPGQLYMNKIKSSFFFLGVFTLFLFLEESCANHEFPSYACPSDPVSFSEDVSPIIVSKCATTGCHNGDGDPSGPGADRNWLDSDRLREQAKNGLVKSYVINRIMPPGSKPPLSQAEIDAIACWIDQGAQDN